MPESGRRRPTAVAVARDYPNGWVVGAHCHFEGQFLHATEGVMEIRTENRLWLAPPGRAVWIRHRSCTS